MTRDPSPRGSSAQRLVAPLFVSLLTLAMVWPIYGSGDSPPGIDVFGHLLKPWYMLQHFHEYGSVPDWLPDWYNGTSLTQYYPPLSYYLLFALGLVAGDIFRAYAIFVTLCLLATAWLTYLLARRWLQLGPSLVAATAFAGAPYSLMTVFWEGNLPRTLAMVFLPLVFLLSVRLLESDSRRNFVALALGMAALVLAHHMPAVAALAGLLPFAAVYSWRRGLELGRPLRVYLALGVGVGLSAWWLIPAVTHLDLPTVPDLSTLPERIDSYSTGLNLLDPRTRLDRNGYLGLSLLLAAALALRGRGYSAVKWGCAAGASLGIFLSLGQNNPLYPYIPFLSQWFPERFLQMSALFLAVLAGVAVQMAGNRLVPRYPRVAFPLLLAVLALLAVDLSPNLALTRPTQQEQLQRAAVSRISEWLATQQNPGRLLVQAAINWETAFTPLSIGKKAQNYGWAPEGSPHTATAQEINYFILNGRYGFPLRFFGLWNTRYVVLESANARQMQLADLMQRQGWRRASLQVPWTVLYLEEPPAPLMKQDREVIVIGRGATTAAALFPWVARGTSWFVDDYAPDFLSQFKGIWLYDYQYRDLGKTEELLNRLASEGRTIWVDLSFREAEPLFEAMPNIVDFKGMVKPQQAGGGRAWIEPGEAIGPFSYSGNQPWRAYLPRPQDRFPTVLQAEVGGFSYPILLRRQVGSGSIYLLGLGLASQAFLNRDARAERLMGDLLQEVKPNSAIAPAVLETESQWWGSQSFGFTATVARPTPVIASVTYTPHWAATIDGAPLRLYNHENLAMFFLPEGRHEVRLVYGWSPAQRVGFAVTGGAVLALILGCLFSARLLTAISTWGWRRTRAVVDWG